MIQAAIPRKAATAVDLNAFARQAMQPWADAYETWRSGVADLVRPAPASKAGCGCPACQSDPCVCRCCVSNADLVVEARVGERRLIPVTIRNHWRRERDIELELSDWTKPGPGVAVAGQIVSPTAFKLAPCGEAQVILVLQIAATDPGGTNQPAQDPKKPTNADAAGGVRVTAAEGRLSDVDRCEVAYADLRIKGCDLRSIRIAVALLPRDCESYAVDCDCACC